MRKILLLLAMFMGFSFLAFSQNKTVSGTVLDEMANPVPFASVLVKGTNTGVSADVSGKFSISVSRGVTLVFSATGYSTVEMPVTATTKTLNIVLTKGQGQLIEEVVISAMGIVKEKRSLGYAAQTVKADQLVQANNSGLAGALQGKVSGVDIVPSSGMPGASALITIRGARSFTGDNSPLYVVDGMPISSAPDISTGNSVTGTDASSRGLDIDPNDIASVEILKGQAASALYGLRGSNGVIVITTKSGAGARKGRPQISFNTAVTMDQLSRTPNLQNVYAQGSNGVYNPTASTSFGPKISDLPDNPTYGGNTVNANTNRDGMHPGMYYVPQRAQAGLDP